jgi:hypothetical protein
MRPMLAAAAVAIFTFGYLAAAQDVTGSGKSVTVKRELPTFTSVEIRTSGKLTINVGKAAPLEITADDNIAPILKTEVIGERLLITSEKTFSTKSDLKFSVGTVELKSLTILGSADCAITGIAGDAFALDINGSGDAKLEGRIVKFTVSVNGTGDVDALKLAARTATITIAGSGDVKTAASESLTATIMGTGDVEYAGSPKVTKTVMGSGEVKQVRPEKKD